VPTFHKPVCNVQACLQCTRGAWEVGRKLGRNDTV